MKTVTAIVVFAAVFAATFGHTHNVKGYYWAAKSANVKRAAAAAAASSAAGFRELLLKNEALVKFLLAGVAKMGKEQR